MLHRHVTSSNWPPPYTITLGDTKQLRGEPALGLRGQAARRCDAERQRQRNEVRDVALGQGVTHTCSPRRGQLGFRHRLRCTEERASRGSQHEGELSTAERVRIDGCSQPLYECVERRRRREATWALAKGLTSSVVHGDISRQTAEHEAAR